MSRYTRFPRAAGWIEDETFSPPASAISLPTVPEHECADTGLLWADGSPVMRAPNPIGFGRDGEWM